MYTFAYLTKDHEVYPPHGLRVAHADTWEELADEVVEFLVEAECSVSDEEAEKLRKLFKERNLPHINEVLDLKLSGSWTLYSTEAGYLMHPVNRGS